MEFMNNKKELIVQSTTIGKLLEKFDNITWQLKENLKLNFKKENSPWPEVSENGIGYWFYDCYIGYSFGVLDNHDLKEYYFSFAIYKSIISKEKLKSIKDEKYGFDEEYYYFKLNEENLENDKELLRRCENIMKKAVKNVK